VFSVRVYCSGNMFIEPSPSSGRLLWLHYSGFQASCHIAPLLRLVVLSSLQVYHHFFYSKGPCLWLPSQMALQWPQCFFLQFRQHPTFICHRSCLSLLFSICSLLGAAHLKHHGPLDSVSPLVCFNNPSSPAIVIGASLGDWASFLALHAWWDFIASINT
jgi:hypothetical protein